MLTKTWVDGNNAKGTRPNSITFTVTASEAVFEGGTASKDFTLTPDADGVWKLDTSTAEGGGWFQKYDSSTGAYISYSIAEKSLDYGTGTNYSNLYSRAWSHEGKDLGYVVGKHHTGDVDTYALTNSLSSTVVPYMNKFWKDKDDPEAQKKRPDIYPVLYRSYTDTEGTHYEQMPYQDRDWKTGVMGDYWWKCTYVAQPRYNAEGYEYTYYVGENFSSTNTNDYVCSGAYDGEPSGSGEASTFDETGKTKTQITLDGEHKIDVAKLSVTTDESGKTSETAGTIVNKPTRDRTVSGSKVWTNLPAGFNKANLPDVTFELWRYHYGKTEKEKEKVTDSEGKAVTTTLKSGSTNFVFDGKFPRYDSEGKPYTYVVTETSPVTMVDAYLVSNDTSNGLVVTNSFKADQNFGVTFTKKWEWPDGYVFSKDNTPSVTMTLSRYLTDSNGAIISGTRAADFATAADGTNTNNTNANTVTLKYEGTNPQTLNWTNLAYYGPNGNPYKYEVEETNVPNGYVVYDAAGAAKVTATTVSGATAYVADVTGTATAGTAGLTNKYGEVLGNINVQKLWSNFGDYSILKKPSVTLKLWRWSYSDPKETPVDLESVKDIPLGTETPQVWQKEITGLEIYAPNGNPYWYILTEGADSTLTLTSSEGRIPRDTAVGSSVAPTGFTVTNINYEIKAQGATISVTNSPVTTSLSVTKAWTFKDDTEPVTPTSAQMLFGSALSAIPTSITYGFLYSTDGSTWNILTDSTAAHNAVTRTVTQSGGSFAGVELKDLPASIYDAEGTVHTAAYKAYEISVTYGSGSSAKTVSRAAGNIADSADIGSLSTSGSTDTGKTGITNSIPMQKLTITKNWVDENNRDGKRPSSLAFTVTRTGVNNETDTQTATVTLTRNTDGTVTASSNGATWNATVSEDGNIWSTSVYVPVYRNDAKVASTYNVTEPAIDYYTSTGSNTGLDYTFKNTHVHGIYDVAVAKVWHDGSTTYDGTTEIPAWFQNYMPDVLTFTLQAKVTDKNGTVTDWTAIDDSTVFTNGDFTGFIGTKTSSVTKAKGNIAETKWTGLPAFASDSDITNLLTYHYRVQESFAEPESKYFTMQYSPDAGVTAGGSITVTNSLDISKLVINKTWDDQNNKYNSRPDAIKYMVEYSTDGSNWTPVPNEWMNTTGDDGVLTVQKSITGSYDATLDMLPKYTDDDKLEYKYRASETALVYGSTDVVPGTSADDAKPYYATSTTDSKQEGSVTTYTASITNTMVYTTFDVTKKWDDTAPGIAGQVSKITYYLQQSTDNGINWKDVVGSDGATKDFWTITTGSAEDAKVTTANLPKYAPDGTLYQYRAIEYSITTATGETFATNAVTTPPTTGTVGGFTDATSPVGTITNTAVTTSVTASKTWADNGDAHGTRPTSVTYHLLQNGTDLGQGYQKTLSGTTTADTWGSVTWENLPKANAAGTAYTYTVKEDTVSGYTSAVTGTGKANDPYVFTNTTIPVKIAKAAAGGSTRISGATFTLSGKFTGGSTIETKTWTSTGAASEAWDLTGLLVQGTVYTLTETVPPTGYTLPSNATTYLKVDAYGNLYEDTSATGEFENYVDKNALLVKDSMNKITISKVGADGRTLLDGATFTITGTFVDATDQTKKTTDIITWTSAASAYELTGRLIAGNTYTIAETVAPNGYLKMQSTFTVTMGTDGHLTAGTLPAGVNVTIDNTTANQSTIKVADEPTAFTVNKYASTGTDHTTPIAGAVFTVTPATGKTFADGSSEARTITTNADGTAGLSAALIADTEYTIQETTAPAGYQLNDPNNARTIRITNAGKLQENVNGTWNDVTGNKLAFSDDKTNATLVKKDKTSGAQISGSTYILAGTFAGGSTSQTLNPSETTAASLAGLMIADNTTTYTLKETVSPAGYKLNRLTDSYSDAVITNGAMTLKMDTDGKLYYASSADGGWTAVIGNALIMQDAKNSLTITKVTSPATVNPRATFDITGIFVDNQDAQTSETRILCDDATSGTMTGKLIAGNSYTIREITPPAGYCGLGDFQITMNADGTITMGELNNLSVSNDGSNNITITATDPQTHVTLTKTDAVGNDLAGAVFTIKPNEGGEFADGKESMIWDTTSNNGLDSTNFVAGQTYYFTETTIPAGYKALPTVTFDDGTINANFAVQMGFQGGLKLLKSDGASTPSYVTIGNTEGKNPSGSITVANSQNIVKLEKVAEGGKTLLPGAVFSITGKFSNGTASYTWTSSTTAETLTGKMIAGNSYTFHEQTAPSGYLVIPDFTVTMGEDGKLTYKTLPDGASGTVTVSYDNDTSANLIRVQDNKTSFALSKVDSSTPAKALTGAKFTVHGIFDDGKGAESDKIWDDKSTAWQGLLIAGNTYSITETDPPAGYKVVEPFSVTMGKDGVLAAPKDAPLPNGVSIKDGVVVTVADEQNSISISKTNTGGSKIAGAGFSLAGTFVNGITSPQTWDSSDKAAELLTGKLIAGNEYALTETKPAPGYVISSFAETYNDVALDANGALVIKVDAQGQLYYKTGENTWAEIADNAIAMKDEQNSISISKTNADGSKMLANAEFSLAGTFVDGTTPQTWDSSDKAAELLAGKLIAGNEYALTETKPAPGYVISSFAKTYDKAVLDANGALVIKVDAQGQLYYKTGEDTWAQIADNAIAMKDEQNSISISKTNTDGSKMLAKAEFSLTGTFVNGNAPQTWTSSDKAAELLAGKLIAGNEYALTETKPAPGYVISSFAETYDKAVLDANGALVIKVDAQGQLYYKTGENTWAEIADNAIAMQDKQNRVTLQKNKPDGTVLSGAEFTVTAQNGFFADGKTTEKTMHGNDVTTDLIGQMVAGVTYTFKEKVTPQGYITIPEFNVTMGTDGQLTSNNLPSGSAGTVVINYENGVNTIKVADGVTKLILKKTDADGKDLTGATFTVTPESGKTFEDGTTDPKTILGKDAKGNLLSEETWTSVLAPDVTYTFEESTSPSAYVTMPSFTVRISSADGKVTVGGDATKVKDAITVGTDDITVTAKNTLMTAEMDLTKVDATSGEALKAKKTTFTLAGKWTDGTTHTQEGITTDIAGQIMISNLPKGDYTLTETGTDGNYVNSRFTATFKVTDACQDKTLVINSENLGDKTPFNLAVTKDDVHLTDKGIANERVLGTVNVEKLGADSKALSGVTFEVHRKSDDSLVGKAGVTDAGGKVSFTDLLWDTYYLVETAVPNGYKLDSTKHEFTIGYDALTVNYTDAAAITNNKNVFTLNKNVAGAEFEISGDFAYGTSPVKLSGAISYIETGLLVGGNSYTVTETKPADGYATVPAFEVTMSKAGELTAKAGTTLPAGVEIENDDTKVNVINVKDPQNVFTVAKTGENSQSLAGAEFVLTADGTSIDSWTIGESDPTENPHKIEGKLIAGKVYKLEETKPAEGYTVMAPVYLKMSNDGKLSESATGTDSWSAVKDNELSVSDVLNKLTIGKSDAEDGSSLSGAQFTLAGTFADGTASEGSETWKSDSTAVKVFTGELVSGNRYTLTEDIPAPGHVLSSFRDTYEDAVLDGPALTVTVDDAGQFFYESTADSGWTALADNAIVMKDARNKVTIKKQGWDLSAAEPQALVGSEFTVTAVDGTFADGKTTVETMLGSQKSTDDLIGQMVARTSYKFSETTTPSGYVTVPDFTLTMGTDGKLKAADGTTLPDDALRGQVELAYKDGGNTITVTDNGTMFTFNKLDEKGDELRNVRFEVKGVFSDSASEAVKTYTVDGPVSILEDMVGGNSYTITEVSAPAGYQMAKPFRVTMGTDGVLSAAAGTTLPERVKIEKNTITVQDILTSLTVLKVDSKNTDVPVLDAHFEMKGDFTDGTAVYDWTTGKTAEVLTGKLKVNTEYTFDETKAADGYLMTTFTESYSDAVLQDHMLVVKFDDLGNLYYKSTAADGWTQVENNAIVIRDEKKPDTPTPTPVTPTPVTPTPTPDTPTPTPPAPVKPVPPITPVTPVTPVTPETPVTPTTPTTPETPQYYDVHHNPVDPDFPGALYDAKGGQVRGARRGYDIEGNVLGAGRGRSGAATGDDSQMVLFGSLSAAAAAALAAWIIEERRKKKKGREE
ncbi:MAG: Cna B-type domain-containing protein [Lachnospiraceae bacterium]|nr:Cna B-type domain-containing protein [Lachnospiraceae bacterium]